MPFKKLEPYTLSQKKFPTGNNSPTHPPTHPLPLQNSNGLPVGRPFNPIKLCRFVLEFTRDISMLQEIANNDYPKFCTCQASR